MLCHLSARIASVHYHAHKHVTQGTEHRALCLLVWYCPN